MKHPLILCALLFIYINAQATVYYFSTAGNNANTGTSPALPFQTLSKASSLPLHPGDTLLFKCGDTFRGQINMNISGTIDSPIVFSSYGTGAKPIISGAALVSGWALNGTRYETTVTQNMYNFFVNDKEQTLARYPNNRQYLWLDVAQEDYLKDADITAISPMANNSKICVHTAQWCWEKTSVASVSGDTIHYTSDLDIAAIAGYGYFLYDNILHLDTANEWKYNSTSHILSYMPPVTQNMATSVYEASVDSLGIKIGFAASYIIIKNLAFEKQWKSGIAILGAGNRYIKIDSCYFARQYQHGVSDRGKYNEVSNSYFREIDGIAVYVNASGSNATIHHNVFRNIGEFRNGGIGTQINLSAIKAAFVDSCVIHHNDIDSTGYCGIAADGGWHLIEKNTINHAMLINNDGAALKTFGSGSHHIIFRNNFVTNSDGNNEGTDNGSFVTPAIYFDFDSNNSLVQDNTIYGRTRKGIFMNSGTHDNTITGNTVYGFNYGIDLNGGDDQQGLDTPISGMIVTGNKLFALDDSTFSIRQFDYLGVYNFGTIDYNYYFQPYDSFYAIRPPARFKFSQWQMNTGNDAHTKKNEFTWAGGIDSSKLFINPTDNTVVQNLEGLQWKDLDGLTVTSLSLLPWTSRILLRTNVAVLPLQLLSFIAQRSGRDVQCNWRTASEQNLSHYNVQRSINGKDYITVGKVNAANNMSANDYSFVDYNVAELNAANTYYRLEAVDKDTKKAYSPVALVQWNNAGPVSIYPNPASGFITVNAVNTRSITIFDISGKKVWQKQDCSDNTVINLSNIAKGAYWVNVNYGDTGVSKLVIVN
jgi:parallel beta-helix repeat protein